VYGWVNGNWGTEVYWERKVGAAEKKGTTKERGKKKRIAGAMREKDPQRKRVLEEQEAGPGQRKEADHFLALRGRLRPRGGGCP